MRLLFGLILLALLIINGPPALAGLAKRNRRQTPPVARRMPALNRTLAHRQQQLEPFRQTRSQDYQQHYQQAYHLLEIVQRRYQRLRQAWQLLVFPPVPEDDWPGQFLLEHPQHLFTIPRTAFCLWQIERGITEINEHLAQLEPILEALEAVPSAIRQRYTALSQTKTTSIEQLLQQERQTGIIQWTDIETNLTTWKQGLNAQAVAVSQVESLPLTARDDLADRLEQLAQQRDAIQQEMHTFVDRRVELDSHYETLHTRLQAVPAQNLPPRLAIPVSQSRHWLALSQQTRQRRDYAAMRQQLDTCACVIEVIEELYRNYQTAQTLARTIAHTPQAQSLTAWQTDFDRLLTQLPLGLTQANPPNQFPIDQNDKLTPLLRQTSALQKRLEQIDRDFQAAQRQLQQRGKTQQEQLKRAWERLRIMLPLDNDDPLAQRYQGVLVRWRQDHHTYNSLTELLDEMGQLTEEFVQWREQIHERLATLDTILRESPQAVDAAANEAGSWACLHILAEQVKNNITTLQTKGAAARQATRTQSFLRLTHEVNTLRENTNHTYQLLLTQAAEIKKRANAVALARKEIIEWGEDLPESKVIRVMKRVERDLEDVHGEKDYQTVLAILQQVEKDLRL